MFYFILNNICVYYCYFNMFNNGVDFVDFIIPLIKMDLDCAIYLKTQTTTQDEKTPY